MFGATAPAKSEDEKHYGFMSECTASGDLLVLLGVADPGTPDYQSFVEYLKKDPFLYAHNDYTIGYRVPPSIQEKQNEFWTCLRAHPISSFAPAFGANCIIVGSSPSLDTRVLNKLQLSGNFIISLGNSILSLARPNIWIGHQNPSSYPSYPFEAPGIPVFIPKKYLGEQIWSSSKKNFGKAAGDYPSVYGYEEAKEFSFSSPKLSDLGSESTLAIGMTLAAGLGFRNIVLMGVSLEGEVDSFYFFPQMPHALIYTRKQQTHVLLRERLPGFCGELLQRGVRVVSTYDLKLENIFHIPLARIENRLGKMSELIKDPLVTQDVTIPSEVKKSNLQAIQKYQSASLTGRDLWDNLDKLAGKLPSFTEAFVADLRRKMLNKDPACSDCSTRSTLGVLQAAFLKDFEADRKATENVWREAIPNRWTLLVRGKFEIRGEEEKSGEESNTSS
jgi:hypothetical protein